MRQIMIEILSVAGIVGLAVVSVALFMSATGKEVPEWLSMSVGIIVGYFYRANGQKPPENKETNKEKDSA